MRISQMDLLKVIHLMIVLILLMVYQKEEKKKDWDIMDMMK